tara:strand:- start:1244 stop:2182 length:939 start_codon:yes stop_codon:yes gene_type:complete
VSSLRVVVFCGGVGAARLLDGIVRVVDDPTEVTAICNVSDDLQWHGLHISPDIDTVIYSLAHREGKFGWGLEGDTNVALEELRLLSGDEWFTVGDGDLATHIWRSEQLRSGATLSEVTTALATARGIKARLIPVTNDKHPTIVITENGELMFQDYFVRRHAEDSVIGFRFPGAESAQPAPGVVEAIDGADLLVIAPSNPFVSIDPLLAISSVRNAVLKSAVPCVAISPIIGGKAVKGPAADMLRSLGHETSALGVARIYNNLIDTFVIDKIDAQLTAEIERLGIDAIVLDTMMRDHKGRTRLASELLAVAIP